jgi:O-methyltransferase involved in polyketide biosynthesis
LIGKSVLDFSWINQVKNYATSNHQPVFFIAEGLFPYLDIAELSELLKRISEIFPQSEIFFDICGEKTVKMMSRHSGIQDWNVQLKKRI